MLRAAGLAIDARKDEPYTSYEKFDFKVPTSDRNDVFGRYQVRVEEMRQSTRIIRQALEGMPPGPWKADAPHVVLPDREKMKTQMEALIYHFKIVTEGFRVPEGEIYVAVESPRGESGCYLVSDGGPKPWRIHFRAPSFVALEATATCLHHALVADLIAVVGSLDAVMGDTDR
jgi:NADH-quinone oxidoreductase subunit D